MIYGFISPVQKLTASPLSFVEISFPHAQQVEAILFPSLSSVVTLAPHLDLIFFGQSLQSDTRLG
jgi:hypothetical protein